MKENAILCSVGFYDVLSTKNEYLTSFGTKFSDTLETLRQIMYLKDSSMIIFSISDYISTYMPLAKYIEVIKDVTKNEMLFKLGSMFVVNGRAILVNGEYVGLERMMAESKGFRLRNYMDELNREVNVKWACIGDKFDCLEIKRSLDGHIETPYNIIVPDSDIKDDTHIIYSSEKSGISGFNDGLISYLKALKEAMFPPQSHINPKVYIEDLRRAEVYLKEIDEMIKRIIGEKHSVDLDDITKLNTLKGNIHALLDIYDSKNRIGEVLWQSMSQLGRIENFANRMGYPRLKKQE